MKNNNIPRNTSLLTSWLSYIEKLHSKDIDMSLDRISIIANRLDILKPAPFVFTVAGTNGKGTTCRVLESILIEAGYKVGVYSSPHLVRYTERVRIQNAELSDSAHIMSFSEIESVRSNISLTYFEYGTLSALWLFKQSRLDVVILEVGLGGRLDATNIIDADIAIITNIALDHIDYFGSDIENIGREKAGIFRAGRPAIIGEIGVPKTISITAKKVGARLLRRGIEWFFFVSKNFWCYSDLRGNLLKISPIHHVPQSNFATAIAALRASPFILNEFTIKKGVQNAILPGRFQVVSQSPRLILDVAHNPHAAEHLVRRLEEENPRIGRVLAVIGMLRDKDIEGTLACMRNMVDIWYCATLECPRGASAEQLMKHVNNGKKYESVVQALLAAIADANLEDTILLFGSFYTVAHVMKNIFCNG